MSLAGKVSVVVNSMGWPLQELDLAGCSKSWSWLATPVIRYRYMLTHRVVMVKPYTGVRLSKMFLLHYIKMSCFRYLSTGSWEENIFMITEISADTFKHQTALWMITARSMTSCCAKCIPEEECHIAVYSADRNCYGYKKTWITLVEVHENVQSSSIHAMIQNDDSGLLPFFSPKFLLRYYGD